MQSLIDQYSGVVVNQNATPTNRLDITDGAWRYQEFFLPSEYARGEQQIIPPLSGLQAMVSVVDSVNASVQWSVERKQFGSPWETIASGTQTGCHAQGNRVWIDLPFADPVSLDSIEDRFRLGLRTMTNVTHVWYAAPNPLAAQFTKALAADGVTAIQDNGLDVSFLFRVLGLVADEGTDFLGNPYRSAVIASAADNVNTVDAAVADKIWRSKPNPSRFAVESLYFDVRPLTARRYDSGGNPIEPAPKDEQSVVDNVLVDPETPNVWFNVYFSSDGDADDTTTEDEWENKLWERVPMSFQATKRETHVLPQPITTKYIKIEFSHLQAKPYTPGNFAKPVSYKKHPQWVLDYFLARTAAAQADQNRLINGRVAVIYDAYDLAYNYYLDDLGQEPDQPVEVTAGTSVPVGTTDFTDQVDPVMLDKIRLALQPYQQHISGFAGDTLLGQYTKAVANSSQADYPVEAVRPVPTTIPADVAALRNTDVIFEADYPVMFFYLTCRHKYREVIASFQYDRAYFVGIREIAFTRENYATAYDADTYIEPAGDLQNIERNDFVNNHGIWVIS